MVEIKMKTSTLLRKLFKATNLPDFLAANTRSMDMPTVISHLDSLCKSKERVREHVIKDAGIERAFGHQLFRGARKLSRDNALRLALGFPLTLEETQELLKIARQTPLHPKVKRDAAVIYGITHDISLVTMQAMLAELGLTVLGGEKYEQGS